MKKAGRPPKGDKPMSPKERTYIYRKNKKDKELLLFKNITTEYDIELIALEKANEVYINIKKQLQLSVEI